MVEGAGERNPSALLMAARMAARYFGESDGHVRSATGPERSGKSDEESSSAAAPAACRACETALKIPVRAIVKRARSALPSGRGTPAMARVILPSSFVLNPLC